MIPALIESYLAATGKSRRRLAHDLDVSNHTIGQWLSGHRIGDDRHLVALLGRVEATSYQRLAVWAERWETDPARIAAIVGIKP